MLLPTSAAQALLGMVALLLVFVVAGRMVEVRVDTVGLLLVNAAWTVVLCSRTTRAMLAAALLAGLVLLFSARAAGMVAVLGLLLLYLSVRSREAATVRALLYAAGSFLAAGVAACLLAPEWVALVIAPASWSLQSSWREACHCVRGSWLSTGFPSPS